MSIELNSTLVPGWPPLAWLARCCPGEPVKVTHGPLVEVGDDWFGEIIWDGDFSHRDFDGADHVFGSGGRLRKDRLTFVGANSVLDRLHWTHHGEDVLVSNSIAALTQEASLEADPNRSDYPAIFRSICRGFEDYTRVVPMKNGQVHLAYMKNLKWDGFELGEERKKKPTYELPDYAAYRRQLDIVINALVANGNHSNRKHPFGLISTISTGYDSPAVTVIARDAGLNHSLTISQGRSGANDDGTEIGEKLGVSVQSFSRDAWRGESLTECLFIAGDAKGEDVYVAGAADQLRQKILFTGYGGTRVWGIKDALNEAFQRGDQSGLSHCEARLHFGYLHLPVPFLVANQPADLRRISKSDEMRPWHVDGSYNCPLARRIVEDANVPREAFGMKKKAASVLLFDRESFLSDSAINHFEAWSCRNTTWFTSSKRRAWRIFALGICKALSMIRSTISMAAQVTGSTYLTRIANSSRLHEAIQHEPRYRHLFPWALRRTQCLYQCGH